MLKKIWHPQHKFSDKLRILNVRTCPQLANLIPSHLIHSFQNLKELVVYNCEVLEYVFDHQGLNRDDGILPKIEILKLEELPKLRFTFDEDKNDNMPYHSSLFKFTALEHIKEIHITKCGNPLDEKVSFLPYFFLFFLMPLEIFRDIYHKNKYFLKKYEKRTLIFNNNFIKLILNSKQL